MKQLDAEAQQVLVYAADEARDLGHTKIGTEHILLGLVCLGGAPAERLGLSVEQTREEVRNAVGRGSGHRTIGELRFTNPARKALELARRNAGPDGATPRDLLRAVLADTRSGAARIAGEPVEAESPRVEELLAEAADPTSVVARALSSLGVDEQDLRDAVDRVRRGAVQS